MAGEEMMEEEEMEARSGPAFVPLLLAQYLKIGHPEFR